MLITIHFVLLCYEVLSRLLGVFVSLPGSILLYITRKRMIIRNIKSIILFFALNHISIIGPAIAALFYPLRYAEPWLSQYSVPPFQVSSNP